MKNQDIMLFDVAKENTYIATYRPGLRMKIER